jgi:hypothetical protein
MLVPARRLFEESQRRCSSLSEDGHREWTEVAAAAEWPPPGDARTPHHLAHGLDAMAVTRHDVTGFNINEGVRSRCDGASACLDCG